MTAKGQQFSQPFRPKARMLQLLGDELISSPRLAVFELVKNAYDADATQVSVELDLRDDREPSITVRDDGEGMPLEVLRDVWLSPGDDHRRRQRLQQKRSPKHRRLPLGEKGLGRFAVHKLGERISLVTRARGADECAVTIDWDELIQKPFLDEAPVSILVRETPQVFKGDATGTVITIERLRQREWTRGEVRRLQRQIVSITSPFEEPSEFKATLSVLGREGWVADIPDVSELLKRAFWKFEFTFADGTLEWSYEFRRVPGLKLEGRRAGSTHDRLLLPPGPDETVARQRQLVAGPDFDDEIGPVKGQFYVFDRDRDVLKRLVDVQMIKDYLDEHGGVRVYRDGIRVYNYGEPGDDWLGLDLRRVNFPTKSISRNIIIGAVHVRLDSSPGLIEKTNREGFVENVAAERFRRIVLGALAKLESERQVDKERIRTITASAKARQERGIERPLAELRRALAQRRLDAEFEPYLSKLEHDYAEMQATVLNAGMSGLNLAVVFHEVERGVRALHQVIVQGADPTLAANQAQDLMHLLDGFASLLRRDPKKVHSAHKLLTSAAIFNKLRFRAHSIELVAPLLEGKGERGFEATFTFNLVLGALNNLIDNAIYWMRVRWPEAPPNLRTPRRLYLGVSHDLEGGAAIIVADTGPGFPSDEPEQLVLPFFTRKPHGMGLGLYYANLAMELNNGRLVFPLPGEVIVPEGFDGAVVALMFGGVK